MARLFHLVRGADVSGVSGTGDVAEGVEFADGRAALRWCRGPARATNVYDSVADVLAIHGHAGSSWVRFADDGEVRR